MKSVFTGKSYHDTFHEIINHKREKLNFKYAWVSNSLTIQGKCCFFNVYILCYIDTESKIKDIIGC